MEWEGSATVTAPASTPSSSRSPLTIITQQHHTHNRIGTEGWNPIATAGWNRQSVYQAYSNQAISRRRPVSGLTRKAGRAVVNGLLNKVRIASHVSCSRVYCTLVANGLLCSLDLCNWRDEAWRGLDLDSEFTILISTRETLTGI